MRIRSSLAVSALALALTFFGQAHAANLVTNGDFEAGNTGFGSDYDYVVSVNQSSGYPEGIYLIDDNPNDIHNLFSSYGDHTTGAGQMMIVNGSTTPGDRVWFENGISVLANTTYFFSTWIASANPGSPAQLNFSINGGAIGTFNAISTTGVWQQFYAQWDSGANTTANIALVNQNTAAGGNDFTLDDIQLDTLRPGPNGAVPEPATWAMMIMGFGLAGAALRRRAPALVRAK